MAAAVATVTTGAQAQVGGQGNQMQNANRVGQRAAGSGASVGADGEKAKANDKAYNAALKNLPDKQYDPWRGVR